LCIRFLTTYNVVFEGIAYLFTVSAGAQVSGNDDDATAELPVGWEKHEGQYIV